MGCTFRLAEIEILKGPNVTEAYSSVEKYELSQLMYVPFWNVFSVLPRFDDSILGLVSSIERRNCKLSDIGRSITPPTLSERSSAKAESEDGVNLEGRSTEVKTCRKERLGSAHLRLGTRPGQPTTR